jgi:signal peptidase I
MEDNMKIMEEVYEWGHSIVIGFALALFLNIFVFQPTRVVGTSMEPTLHQNDYLFVSKLSHTFGIEPNYGDIVIIDSRVDRPRTWKDDVSDPVFVYLSIFHKPATNHEFWVKRVIGKPGDVLEFHNGKVSRNGKLLHEPYLAQGTTNFPKDARIVVPKGDVFVMGDNRNYSMDSRIIGPVPLDHVLGTVIGKI